MRERKKVWGPKRDFPLWAIFGGSPECWSTGLGNAYSQELNAGPLPAGERREIAPGYQQVCTETQFKY